MSAARGFHCLNVCLLALLALLLPVRAQEAEKKPAGGSDVVRLAPVTVTASKRQADVRKEPQSVTAFDADMIRRAGIRNIKDASRLVPNLYITEFSSRRLSFPFLRGIGSGQGTPAVTTHIDGVPRLSVSSSNIPLLDVERIEVLRGPQGALYGRNTLGGSINIVSRAPGETPRHNFAATIGDFSFTELSLSSSGPLPADNLYYGLAGSFTSRDGFSENDITGRELDNREFYYGRARLRWAPSDELDVHLSLARERSRDGALVLFDAAALRDDLHHISTDFEGHADRDIFSPALTVNYYGGEIDVTSITGYEQWAVEDVSDIDFTAMDLLRRYADEEMQQFSQELRLASAEDADLDIGAEVSAKWLAGLFLFRSDYERHAISEYRPMMGFFPPFFAGPQATDSDFIDWGIGVFGQTTLTFRDKLDLTLGLRYDHERRRGDIANWTTPANGLGADSFESLADDFGQVSPRLGLAYHWTGDLMTYAFAAKGFKSGGFNSVAPAGEFAFDEEDNWTYEVGLKSSWLDDRLTANLAFFHIQWDDMQLDVFDATHGTFYLDNVGEAESSGFEAELRARPSDWLELFAGAGFTDAEFEEYTDPTAGDVSGNDLIMTPQYTWNAGIDNRFQLRGDLSLFARTEVVGIGQFNYNAGNTAEQDNYWLLNVRAGLQYRNWRAELWMRNALDEEYIPIAYEVTPGTFVGESGAPQTFGVTVGLTF